MSCLLMLYLLSPRGGSSAIHYKKLGNSFVLRKFDHPFISLTAVNNVLKLINSRIFTLHF